VAAALVGPVGCGGSAHSHQPALQPPTSRLDNAVETTARSPAKTRPAPKAAVDVPGGSPRSRFVAAAEGVCRGLNDALARNDKAARSHGSNVAIELRNAELERIALKQLSEFAPPADLRSGWKRLIRARLLLAQDLVAMAQATQRGDKSAARKLSSAKALLHLQLLVVAEHYGFKDCAKVGKAYKPPVVLP
jgi:hypothetical protein